MLFILSLPAFNAVTVIEMDRMATPTSYSLTSMSQPRRHIGFGKDCSHMLEAVMADHDYSQEKTRLFGGTACFAYNCFNYNNPWSRQFQQTLIYK